MDERLRRQKITGLMQKFGMVYGVDDFHKKWPVVQFAIDELIRSDYAIETIEEALRSVRKKSPVYMPTLALIEVECDNLGAEGIGRPSISKLRTLHQDDMIRLYEIIESKNRFLKLNIPNNPLIPSNPDIYNEYLMDRKLANDPDFNSFEFIDTGKVVRKVRIES